MQPDEGACILLDELFGFSSALVMYDSELDDGNCAIYSHYRWTTIVTKLTHPRTALAGG